MSETGSPVAGWYEDPQDAANVRWWDGIGWTDHTQARPSEHPSVPADPAPAAPVVAPTPAATPAPAAVAPVVDSSPSAVPVPTPEAPSAVPVQAPDAPPAPDAAWLPPEQATASTAEVSGQSPAVPQPGVAPQPGGAFAPPSDVPTTDDPTAVMPPADTPAPLAGSSDLPVVAPESGVPVPPVPSINPPLPEYAQVGSTPISAPLTESGEPKSGKGKLIMIILLVLVLLIAVGVGGWFYLQSKKSDTAAPVGAEVTSQTASGQSSATGSTGATTSSSATAGDDAAVAAATAVPAACSQAVSSLTADGTASAVAAQLRAAAAGGNVTDAAALLTDIAGQSNQVMTGDGADCQAAVTTGKAPAAYSSFLVTFQRSVSTGQATLTAVAKNKGKMTAAQKQQLRSDGDALLAAQRVVAADAPVVSAAPPAG